ncbi:MAG: hypothetical protein WKF75_00580 [Singulisphaera sp.]
MKNILNMKHISRICFFVALIDVLFCFCRTLRADDPSAKQRYHSEYPPALKKLEQFYSQLRGSGTQTDEQGKLTNVYSTQFWFDGNLSRCDRTRAKDGTGQRTGRESALVARPGRHFSLVRDSKNSSWQIASLGNYSQEIPAEINYYSRQWVVAPFGLDVPISLLMADKGFAIGNVTKTTEGGKELFRVEFDYRPANTKSLFIGSPPSKVIRIAGWMLVDPDDAWIIHRIEIREDFTGDESFVRTGKVEYGDRSEGILSSSGCRSPGSTWTSPPPIWISGLTTWFTSLHRSLISL